MKVEANRTGCISLFRTDGYQMVALAAGTGGFVAESPPNTDPLPAIPRVARASRCFRGLLTHTISRRGA